MNIENVIIEQCLIYKKKSEEEKIAGYSAGSNTYTERVFPFIILLYNLVFK